MHDFTRDYWLGALQFVIRSKMTSDRFAAKALKLVHSEGERTKNNSNRKKNEDTALKLAVEFQNAIQALTMGISKRNQTAIISSYLYSLNKRLEKSVADFIN